MARVTVAVVIDRPVDEVFAFVSDPGNDPQWWRGVRAVHKVSDVEYDQDSVLFGRRFVARIRVVERDPPRRVVLASEGSATPFLATYRFDDLAGGRRTRLELDGTVRAIGVYRVLGPVFAVLLRLLTRRYFGNLKRVLERG